MVECLSEVRLSNKSGSLPFEGGRWIGVRAGLETEGAPYRVQLRLVTALRADEVSAWYSVDGAAFDGPLTDLTAGRSQWRRYGVTVREVNEK